MNISILKSPDTKAIKIDVDAVRNDPKKIENYTASDYRKLAAAIQILNETNYNNTSNSRQILSLSHPP